MSYTPRDCEVCGTPTREGSAWCDEHVPPLRELLKAVEAERGLDDPANPDESPAATSTADGDFPEMEERSGDDRRSGVGDEARERVEERLRALSHEETITWIRQLQNEAALRSTPSEQSADF